MNTDKENWIESHLEEYRFYESIDWIAKKYPKVYDQFMKELKEHSWGCKHDKYYAYCYGGGNVPVPCCQYCTEYNGDSCMKEWNNADPCYYIDWRDDKEPDDLCEDYEWNGEWEE